MKKVSILILLFFASAGAMQSHAQLLRKLGERVEQKVNDRIERKVDQNIDKALDKAEESLTETESSAVEPEKTTTEVVSTTTAVDTNPITDGIIMVGSDCSDFIWFKSNAMMEFDYMDDKGKSVMKTKMRVTNISNEGIATVADVLTSDDKGNEFNMQFKCAGDKLYMDFAAMMKQAMEQQNVENSAEVEEASKNLEMGFSDGFMSFPKNMYPGQKLDDITFTMKTGTSGVNMEITSALLERSVVSRETITTPAGTFDCLKITGKRSSRMKVMGMNRNMGNPELEITWFAPGLGFIKQEYYSEKGKLISSSQLIAYEL